MERFRMRGPGRNPMKCKIKGGDISVSEISYYSVKLQLDDGRVILLDFGNASAALRFGRDLQKRAKKLLRKA